jgi:hypothetical protein
VTGFSSHKNRLAGAIPPTLSRLSQEFNVLFGQDAPFIALAQGTFETVGARRCLTSFDHLPSSFHIYFYHVHHKSAGHRPSMMSSAIAAIIH